MLHKPFDGDFPITSSYGFRLDPFTGEPSGHAGVDFGIPAGVPMLAVGDGEVLYSAFEADAGNTVTILLDDQPPDAPRWGYMHLTERFVRQGERVSAGQAIGSCGSTGRSTGPHAHIWCGHSTRDTRDPWPHLIGAAVGGAAAPEPQRSPSRSQEIDMVPFGGLWLTFHVKGTDLVQNAFEVSAEGRRHVLDEAVILRGGCVPGAIPEVKAIEAFGQILVSVAGEGERMRFISYDAGTNLWYSADGSPNGIARNGPHFNPA